MFFSISYNVLLLWVRHSIPCQAFVVASSCLCIGPQITLEGGEQKVGKPQAEHESRWFLAPESRGKYTGVASTFSASDTNSKQPVATCSHVNHAV